MDRKTRFCWIYLLSLNLNLTYILLIRHDYQNYPTFYSESQDVLFNTFKNVILCTLPYKQNFDKYSLQMNLTLFENEKSQIRILRPLKHLLLSKQNVLFQLEKVEIFMVKVDIS